jgi:general secretion pathway protein D
LTGSSNTFRFEEAPILDVVHVVLRDILKVDYMVHPPVSGSVTLATKGAVSADEAAYLLEGALLANGLIMARDSRGTYHVGRPEALRGIVTVPRQVGGGPLAPGYGAIVIPLQFIGAAEMATILRPMLPPEALVRVDPVRNLIVLVGNRTQAEGWLSIVSTFDVDLLKGMSVGVFPLKHASVREVEAALRVISGGRAAAAPAAPGVPAPRGQAAAAAAAAAAAQAEAGLIENPFLGAVRVMPIERLNSILVVTPRAAYIKQP